MEVSTFELLFKPQSPSAPSGVLAVERVIQGYFLTITNLEDTEYRYGLEFIQFPPPATSPFRSLAGNTLVFVDTPGTDNQPGILSGAPTASTFRPSTGFIRIPPQGTALVAVLPSAFGPNPLDPTPLVTPEFEVRGYVRLTLPALLQFNGSILSLRREAQSESPVRVLVTPQHRATFLTASGAISDQIQATLPVASGQALNEIEPEEGGPLVFEVDSLSSDVSSVARLVEERPEMLTPNMLAAILSQLDGEKSDLKKFNKELSELDIPFAIERRNK